MSKEAAAADKPTKGKKSFVEQTSLINEVIKRENRFYSINKVFTLNPRKCKKIVLFFSNCNCGKTDFLQTQSQ